MYVKLANLRREGYIFHYFFFSHPDNRSNMTNHRHRKPLNKTSRAKQQQSTNSQQPLPPLQTRARSAIL